MNDHSIVVHTNKYRQSVRGGRAHDDYPAAGRVRRGERPGGRPDHSQATQASSALAGERRS
ncbi:MAG: hypothetical protein KJ065_14155 [Anaerolineae bacterium]|nr:hypothetical protein [Anaerolineae bacterium]